MAASRAGDTATVLSLMSDDVVFLMPGRPPMIGKQAFAATMQAPPGASAPRIDGRCDIQEVQVTGDWAFIWTKLAVQITPPDESTPQRRSGHTLTILRKVDGRWLLARDANMLTPE